VANFSGEKNILDPLSEVAPAFLVIVDLVKQFSLTESKNPDEGFRVHCGELLRER
jgi:hypothetical protein